LRTLEGQSGELHWVAFSPDGQHVAATDSFRVTIWDASTGKKLRSLQRKIEIIKSASFSPDGLGIAAVGVDRTVMLWNVRTGNLERVIQGHTDTVNSVSFSPDGQRLVSAGDDRTLKIWDATSDQEFRTLKGHQDRRDDLTRAFMPGWVQSVTFGPDGRLLA